MPAKRKTNQRTDAALRALLIDAHEQWQNLEREEWPPLGLERTPGYTIHRHKWKPNQNPIAWKRVVGVEVHRNPEPPVWVLRRHIKRGVLADPLVLAVWATLPKTERRRSRLFACCADHPVRFTKKGAIADALRHDRPLGSYSPPTGKERRAAAMREASPPPPDLVPGNQNESAWQSLGHALRTLYATLRPSGEHSFREWALEGCPSPEAWTSSSHRQDGPVRRQPAGWCRGAL